MKRILIAVLIALGIVALSAEARTAFAQGPLRQCFPGEAARARLAFDGYALVAEGIAGRGSVLIQIWSRKRDKRFMITNIDAENDNLCIAVAGVNWQNYKVPK